MEDSLYEIESMRRFAGLRISDPLADETTLLKFRHLLEKHGLGNQLFNEIGKHLESKGLRLKEGTIVDASIISAPKSTKNKLGKRDPEMHQTKKGNEWHFGMKIHRGVDESLGLIHSMEVTAANHHDITVADKLLHGDEKRAWGDTGYTGIEKREAHLSRDIHWQIAAKPSKRAQMPKSRSKAKHEKIKASVSANVEHPFLTIKKQFGYEKVRYRGLYKNAQRLYVLSGFANLLKVKSALLV